MKDELVDTIASLKVGDVSRLLELHGRGDQEGRVRQAHAPRSPRRARPAAWRSFAGGGTDDREGWFVRPTLLTTEDPMRAPHARRVLRPDRDAARLSRRRRGKTRCELVDRTSPVRADRRRVRARSRGDRRGDRTRCAMRPATSTSTTSRPARSSASSRSAARARRAPTTRPARRSTCCAGSRRGRSRRRSCSPTDYRYPFLDEP